MDQNLELFPSWKISYNRVKKPFCTSCLLKLCRKQCSRNCLSLFIAWEARQMSLSILLRKALKSTIQHCNINRKIFPFTYEISHSPLQLCFDEKRKWKYQSCVSGNTVNDVDL